MERAVWYALCDIAHPLVIIIYHSLLFSDKNRFISDDNCLYGVIHHPLDHVWWAKVKKGRDGVGQVQLVV